jgi:hypothetical protein
MRNRELIERAQDSRGPLLTRAEVDILWEQAKQAMLTGSYQEAFASVEALLCQADWDGEVVMDLLPDPRSTTIAEGRTREGLQSFIDRVEYLNNRAGRL